MSPVPSLYQRINAYGVVLQNREHLAARHSNPEWFGSIPELMSFHVDKSERWMAYVEKDPMRSVGLGETFELAAVDYFNKRYPKGRPADMEARALAVPVFAELLRVQAKPIDMVLFCPACGRQHIDADNCDEVRIAAAERGFTHGTRDWEAYLEDNEWTNPPHRSHQCAACGHVWRPADVPTQGVHDTKTHGKNDMMLFGDAATAQGLPTQAQIDSGPHAGLGNTPSDYQRKPGRPDAGHPLLQKLVDSIEIVNERVSWDYMAMYEVRDALRGFGKR